MSPESLALLAMILGGGLGGFFAAIFSKVEFPVANGGGRSLQRFFRQNPVLSLSLAGMLGGLLVPLVIATTSGVFGENSVVDRVFDPAACGEIRNVIATYRAAMTEDGFQNQQFMNALTDLNLKGNASTHCKTFWFDIGVMFGLSLVAGAAARTVIPSLSDRLLAQIETAVKDARSAADEAKTAKGEAVTAAAKIAGRNV